MTITKDQGRLPTAPSSHNPLERRIAYEQRAAVLAECVERFRRRAAVERDAGRESAAGALEAVADECASEARDLQVHLGRECL